MRPHVGPLNLHGQRPVLYGLVQVADLHVRPDSLCQIMV